MRGRYRESLDSVAAATSHNLRKAFYDSIRTFSARQIPTFATKEEAMEYLVS